MGIHNVIQTEEARSRPHWREAISGRFFTQPYLGLTDRHAMFNFQVLRINVVYTVLTSTSVVVDR